MKKSIWGIARSRGRVATGGIFLGGLPLLLTTQVLAQTLDPQVKPAATKPDAVVPKVTLNSDPATWQSGEVRLNDVLYDLSRPEVLRGSPFEDMVRRDLLKLMNDYGDGGVTFSKALKNGKSPAKRWVGYAYAAAGDERAVPLLEDLLAQTPKPVRTKASAVNLTYLLLCLSSYYEKKGDLVKAAKTELRSLDYVQGFMPRDPAGSKVPVAGMIANHIISAARLYRQAGDGEKAKELYAQVQDFDYGWASGLALFDQAHVLIEKGQHEAARELLQQPVTGLYADQIKVEMLSSLAYSYYRTGDFEAARRYGEQSIALYKTLGEPLTEDGVSDDRAQQLLRWIEQWLKAPLMVEPNKLSVTVRQGQAYSEPLKMGVLARSSRPVPLEVTTNNEGVTARVEGDAGSSEYFYQRKIALEIRPQSFAKTTEVVLKVKSPQFPDLSLSVPLVVEVRSAIEVSPSSLFFGEVAASKSATATVEVSAPMPFRILSVTPDDAALQVETDAGQMPGNQPAARHTLKLKFTSPQVGTPPQVGGFYSGTLHIKTDVPNEEVIKVPYVARTR